MYGLAEVWNVLCCFYLGLINYGKLTNTLWSGRPLPILTRAGRPPPVHCRFMSVMAGVGELCPMRETFISRGKESMMQQRSWARQGCTLRWQIDTWIHALRILSTNRNMCKQKNFTFLPCSTAGSQSRRKNPRYLLLILLTDKQTVRSGADSTA